MMRMNRRRGDRIVVDGPATVFVDGMGRGKVTLRIDAPRSTTIQVKEAEREDRAHQRRPS